MIHDDNHDNNNEDDDITNQFQHKLKIENHDTTCQINHGSTNRSNINHHNHHHDRLLSSSSDDRIFQRIVHQIISNLQSNNEQYRFYKIDHNTHIHFDWNYHHHQQQPHQSSLSSSQPLSSLATTSPSDKKEDSMWTEHKKKKQSK